MIERGRGGPARVRRLTVVATVLAVLTGGLIAAGLSRPETRVAPVAPGAVVLQGAAPMGPGVTPTPPPGS